jgi:peroxiredoxin
MTTPTASPQTYSNSHRSALSPLTQAPDFTLRCTPDQSVSLSEFRGRPVVLAFYPADWSPVCGDQMTLYNEMLDEFQEFQAELVGISVDGAWCHAAFAKENKLHFPLLADFEPKGAVARAYGVYDGQEGMCQRALFVIRPDGIIHWSYLSPIGINPGANGILSALEDLKAKNKTTVASK